MSVKEVEYKTRKCRRCGEMFRVKSWSKRRICSKCAMQIQKELVRQLKEGKGPYYDTWLEGLERYIRVSGRVEEWLNKNK